MVNLGSALVTCVLLLAVLCPSSGIENGGFLPYGGVVKITTKYSDYTMCNGALITYDLVLTTASCVARPLLQNSFVIHSFESTIPVRQIIYHGLYFENMLGSGIGDIAILVLGLPIEDKESDILNPLFLERVKSNLASPSGEMKTYDRDDATFLVSAFGYTAPETLPVDPLYASAAYLATHQAGRCTELYRKFFGNVSDYEPRHFLCSYDQMRILPAPCERDQGTPLYFVKKRCTRRVPLHGLVVAPFCSGKPTFYLRISYYKTWILQTVQKYSAYELPLIRDAVKV